MLQKEKMLIGGLEVRNYVGKRSLTNSATHKIKID